MKKTLLVFLSVMAFAGMSVAQDVYTSGYYTNSQNTYNAAVYKNGELLYSTGNSASSYHHSTDVLFFGDAVFWVDNCFDANLQNNYGDVFMDDERVLSTPIGSGGCIYRLFTDGHDLYSAGCVNVNGVQSPAIWKNDDPSPYIVYNTDGNPGVIYDAVIVGNVIYACGCKTVDGDDIGVVWSDEGEYYNFGEDVIPNAVAFYNDDLYFAVNDYDNDKGMVFINGYEYYTVTSDGGVYYINIDAGDIYVTGTDYEDGTDRIWKNGETLYDCYYATHVEANSEGVFYTGYNENDLGQVWQDGAALYVNEDCEMMTGISVDLSCPDETPLSLPFYDGFENGETHWTCWHVLDNDDANYGEASYWHRGGINQDIYPATGNYCAWHRYNGDNSQEGWLITPYLQLPSGGNITMTFKTYEEYSSDYVHEAVWVGTEDSEAEVWVQNDPTAEWKTVTIDLSDYQGQLVVVGFLYTGEDAHSWYIDDVSITQTADVEESEVGCLAVYPSPARESIRIEGLNANSEVQIYNVLGELVKTTYVGANEEISVSELSDGVYFVRCNNTTLRFVKN